jgi:hypothetical protein
MSGLLQTSDSTGCDPEMTGSIAKVARRVGDWELVEHTAQRMIQHDSSYAGGYLALGWAAEHQGDALAARQSFATAEKL